MAISLSESKIHEILWPTCAKCGVPVKKFVRENNFLNDTLIFGVSCHGEKEMFTCNKELLYMLHDALKKGDFIASKAFEDKVKKIACDNKSAKKQDCKRIN